MNAKKSPLTYSTEPITQEDSERSLYITWHKPVVHTAPSSWNIEVAEPPAHLRWSECLRAPKIHVETPKVMTVRGGAFGQSPPQWD